MIFAEMFETVNSQFVFIKTFFGGSEVRETWYGKLHAHGLVVLTATQHYQGEKTKSPEVLFICERFSWIVVDSR